MAVHTLLPTMLVLLLGIFNAVDAAAQAPKADPWLDPAYQKAQWKLALDKSADDSFLQKLCGQTYQAQTLTSKIVTTTTSTRKLVSILPTTLTVSSVVRTSSTSLSVSSVISTRILSVKSRTTTTSTQTVTATAYLEERRRRRYNVARADRLEKRAVQAAQATGKAATHQQITTVFNKVGTYNPDARDDWCGLLIDTIITKSSTRVIPTSTVQTKTATRTKSVLTTSTAVVVKPTTMYATTSTTVTVPQIATKRVLTTTTIVLPPIQTSSPSYVSCGDAPLNYYLSGVTVVGGRTKCDFTSSIVDDTEVACTYSSINGNLVGDNVDDICPTSINTSDNIGTGCYWAGSCPTWDGHDIDYYGTGQVLTLQDDETWQLNLQCSYDNGNSACTYDEDSEQLIHGDDQCPDSLTDGDDQDDLHNEDGVPTGACVFPGDPPIPANNTNTNPPPPPPASLANVTYLPSYTLSFRCPYTIGDGSGATLKQETYDEETAECYYGDNANEYTEVSCKYRLSDLSVISGSPDACSPPSNELTLNSAFPYHACPPKIGSDTLRTDSIFRIDTNSQTKSTEAAYAYCQYASGLRCSYNATTGITWTPDQRCPRDLRNITDTPTPPPPPSVDVDFYPPEALAFRCPTTFNGDSSVTLKQESYDTKEAECYYGSTSNDYTGAFCKYRLSDKTVVSGNTQLCSRPSDDLTLNTLFPYHACPAKLGSEPLRNDSLFRIDTNSQTQTISHAYMYCRYGSPEVDCAYDAATGVGWQTDSSCPMNITQTAVSPDPTSTPTPDPTVAANTTSIPPEARAYHCPATYGTTSAIQQEQFGQTELTCWYGSKSSNTATGEMCKYRLSDKALISGNSNTCLALASSTSLNEEYAYHGCPTTVGSDDLRGDSFFQATYDARNNNLVDTVMICRYGTNDAQCLYRPNNGNLLGSAGPCPAQTKPTGSSPSSTAPTPVAITAIPPVPVNFRCNPAYGGYPNYNLQHQLYRGDQVSCYYADKVSGEIRVGCAYNFDTGNLWGGGEGCLPVARQNNALAEYQYHGCPPNRGDGSSLQTQFSWLVLFHDYRTGAVNGTEMDCMYAGNGGDCFYNAMTGRGGDSIQGLRNGQTCALQLSPLAS